MAFLYRFPGFDQKSDAYRQGLKGAQQAVRSLTDNMQGTTGIWQSTRAETTGIVTESHWERAAPAPAQKQPVQARWRSWNQRAGGSGRSGDGKDRLSFHNALLRNPN